MGECLKKRVDRACRRRMPAARCRRKYKCAHSPQRDGFAGSGPSGIDDRVYPSAATRPRRVVDLNQDLAVLGGHEAFNTGTEIDIGRHRSVADALPRRPQAQGFRSRHKLHMWPHIRRHRPDLYRTAVEPTDYRTAGSPLRHLDPREERHFTDEPGDKRRIGPFIDLRRRTDLLNDAVAYITTTRSERLIASTRSCVT